MKSWLHYMLSLKEHWKCACCCNIIEYLNSVSGKMWLCHQSKRNYCNFSTLLNRNLHPDCNNWTNIYPQCVKGNSFPGWHLAKSSAVQIGQRKLTGQEKGTKSHPEILSSRHISTEFQTNPYFPLEQIQAFLKKRIKKPHYYWITQDGTRWSSD